MAISDNLIAHWKFEEDAGSSRVDSLGSYTLPEYIGQVARITGKIGSYAARFNNPSSNNYLRTASLAQAFHPTTAYTVTAWIYRGNDFVTSDDWTFFVEAGTTAPLSFGLIYSSGYIIRVNHRTTSGYVNRDATSTLQSWQFVAVRWTGSVLSLSVNDGTPVTVAATSIIAWADAGVTDFRVGRRTGLDQDNYVDSMTFWHRSLTDGEITQLFGNGNGWDYPFSSGTIKATYVALSGLTDANGQITMGRVFASDQPVIGRIRKSSSQPYYKTKNISGTIDSATGLSVTAQLAKDE